MFSSEHYVVGVKWVNDNLVSVIWMNRAQNLSVITHCEERRLWACHEVSSFKCSKMHIKL